MKVERKERLLIRPADAFEIIGVSRSTGYALIAAKDIPSVKIGRSIRIPVDQLHTWIENKVREAIGQTNE
jgi:excisionase family DNA binding protein